MKPPAGVLNTDPTASFLLELEKAGYQPIVANVRGAVLLELVGPRLDDHWLITMDEGVVGVSNRPGPADAVVRMPRELFAAAVRGCANLWTAILRNEVKVDGDLPLLLAFERLLPGEDPGR